MHAFPYNTKHKKICSHQSTPPKNQTFNIVTNIIFYYDEDDDGCEKNNVIKMVRAI